MADIRLKRPRVGINIWMWPADLADVFGQYDALNSLETDELVKIKKSVEQILAERNPHENPDTFKPA